MLPKSLIDKGVATLKYEHGSTKTLNVEDLIVYKWRYKAGNRNLPQLPLIYNAGYITTYLVELGKVHYNLHHFQGESSTYSVKLGSGQAGNCVATGRC
ncbi:hypothetical protein F4555_001404 [Mobiluncus mulieris]|uniref:Uncharacterized protein n=1 Tax=Mobiluncus mulieris TaxID=2052 RepID=A0A2J9KSE5_9ACTO|nr:hypothetical protein [Mobiluncus mulieris]MBB5846608.1 hypothetical protein [Mobiluncus mulieris]PNL44166.1 hypothetical protein CEP82_010480 [Mobiluncus mulieris]STO16918.1 Uncharacterised protein [Mobiluncus mulieris]STY85293.1 Uncharacterised protein [Mobiluncus mulieris]